MINERDKLIEDLFQEAAELPAPERARWLADHCGSDAGLRAEIETLLVHYDQADGQFLNAPAFSLAGDDARNSAFPQRVGSYRLIRKIGEGGMGVVYEAAQENPSRKVALKIIRPGFASKQMLRRFRQESEVLGRLQHPGIAHIYEAGTAEITMPAGFTVQQPFFAMEFIRGESLNAYIDTRGLTTRERLELVARICDAVQHAHQQGVIHRDLKPGNILVVDEGGDTKVTDHGTRETSAGSTTRADRVGQPKILDFGVARATDSDIQTLTMQTDAGQIIGTVPYMSPEQLTGDSSGLDVRADVYALGVILYETLSGRLPIDVRNRSIPEAARMIREDEPTRLSSIHNDFRGDIDTIVSKALEKDKTRRYESAAGLADELRRYLRDEPIVARAPSAVYQFRKFAKRNKALVGGVLAVIGVLTLGVIGTTVGMLRAFDSEKLAQSRLEESVASYKKAEAETEKARVEAAKSQAVNQFVQDMLGSVDPAQKGRDVTVRDTLEAAEQKIAEGSLKDQPQVEAAVRYTLGSVYFSLGQYSDAEGQLRASLELSQRLAGDQPDESVARALAQLGLLLWRDSRIEEAEPFLRESLDAYRKLFGDEHAEVATALNNVGLILKAQGKLDEAEAIFRESLAMRRRVLGDLHDDIGQSLNNLAQTLRAKGDYAGSEPLYLEAMEVQRKIEGDEHPNIASLMDNLGGLYQQLGRFDESEKMFNDSLAMRRKLYGEQNPDVARSLNNLAILMRRMNRFDESEKLYRESLDLRRALFGEEHLEIAQTLGNLGALMNSKGDYQAGEEINRKALEMRRKLLGEDHIDVATSLNHLATSLMYLDKSEEAEPLYQEGLAIRRKSLGDDHPDVGAALYNLGFFHRRAGRFEEAEPLFRQALDIRLKRLPATHVDTALNQAALGSVLVAMRRFDEAEPLLLKSFESVRNQPAATAKTKSDIIDQIIKLYEDWDRPEQAKPWREQLSTHSSS